MFVCRLFLGDTLPQRHVKERRPYYNQIIVRIFILSNYSVIHIIIKPTRCAINFPEENTFKDEQLSKIPPSPRVPHHHHMGIWEETGVPAAGFSSVGSLCSATAVASRLSVFHQLQLQRTALHWCGNEGRRSRQAAHSSISEGRRGQREGKKLCSFILAQVRKASGCFWVCFPKIKRQQPSGSLRPTSRSDCEDGWSHYSRF